MSGIPGTGPYVTVKKPYLEAVASIINDNKPLLFVDKKTIKITKTKIVKDFLNAVKTKNNSKILSIIKNGRTYNPFFNGYTWTQIEKAQFTGRSGSGGGAEDTALTECLQCFYCSYVFNKAKKIITRKTFTNLKQQLESTSKNVHTDRTLKQCLEKGPENWIEDDVYIKTANKLYKAYGKKFKGPVHFHRGSQFMNNVYKAYTETKKVDKASNKPQAPGSFSADKWNPGDIWASTFNAAATPLKEFTSNWGELNFNVLKLAGGGISKSAEAKLLGISLKRVAANQKEAKIDEFSTPALMKTREEFKWKFYKYGKTGDFFTSQDIYVEIGEKEVQFRTFGGETSWQGEIKGTAAAGGKIGGGNIDFYCKQIFNKSIYYPKTTESEFLAYTKTKAFKYEDTLYSLYKTHRSKGKNAKPEISKKEFLQNLIKQDDKFRNSKIICMNFLNVVQSGTIKQKNDFATKLFRYASSDTDQSSYFVKLY